MELSLRLDTLGMVEMRYLRGRDRYRDWPGFLLHAASRQARVMAYLTHDVAEQLHQQILVVESTMGIDEDDDDEIDIDEIGHREETRSTEREGAPFSPALASALDQLNKLARQRLPEGSSGASSELPASSGELPSETELAEGDEEDALEQLQDAFVQMMEVVRELAEELSTDALKLTGRFRCARTNIEFVQAEIDDEDEENESDGNDTVHIRDAEDGVEVEMELELVMVLQLFEEGRARPDDLPAVELQLDVDDFERLHETLDIALEYERKSRRRK